MKHIWIAAAFAAAPGQPCLAQTTIHWQLATGYRAESFHTQNIERMAADLARASAGRLRIEVKPNSALVKLADIRQAVQDGKVQAGETYEINAWFPKNIVFVNRKAFEALAPDLQQMLLAAGQEAETRGWALSQAAAADATSELRSRGLQVGRVPPDFEADLKRMGEKFSLEWVRSVGNEANGIFVPYYVDSKR